MAGPILIVGDRGIGDMILAHSLLRALGEQEPASPIDVIAAPNNADIARLFPEVRKVLVFENRSGQLNLARRFALLRQIRKGGYAQAFILRHYLKDALLPWLARIPRRIGWHGGEGRHLLLTTAMPEELRPAHRAREVAALAHPAGSEFELLMPQLTVPAEGEKELNDKHSELISESHMTAICPGGISTRGKQWPAENYAKLADWLASKSHRVLILGAASDQERARQIIDASKAGDSFLGDMTGKLSLLASLALLARCRLLVSNDTGLMHAGAALGIATLGVFVKTEPATWKPVGAKADYIAPPASTAPADTVAVDDVIVRLEGLLGAA